MEIVIALIALTCLEIVLGIDNLVYISVISDKLPAEQQKSARRLGLIFALVTRLMLLAVVSFIVTKLTGPLFDLTNLGMPEALLAQLSGEPAGSEKFLEAALVSGKDLVLFFGGLFLIANSVKEIHDEMRHLQDEEITGKSTSFVKVVTQIAIFDIIFSLDSVITAVGMVNDIAEEHSFYVMAGAICIAILVMIIAAEPVSRFVSKNPTIKMLALSFLILIGVMLVAESIGAHVDKGYVYFAMAFALIVEFLNLRLRKTVESKEKNLTKEQQVTPLPSE